MSNFQAVGITDQQVVCDHCGKRDLNQTVVLRDEAGEFSFFGTVCAARALGLKPKNPMDASFKIRDEIYKAKKAEHERNLEELIESSDRFALMMAWTYKPSEKWEVFSNGWLKTGGVQFLERAAASPAKYPAEAVVLISKMVALRILTDI